MEHLIVKFKETEEKYKELREKLTRGEVTTEQMKADLMRLMVQDETGKYWMLGGKTGKWYIHDGNRWNEADPYERFTAPITREIPQKETSETMLIEQPFPSDEKESAVSEPARTIEFHEYDDDIKPREEPKKQQYSYIEQEEEIKVSQVSRRDYDTIECKVCKSRIPSYSVFCQICGANQKELDEKTMSAKPSTKKEGESELLIKSIKYTSLIFFLGGLGLILGVIWGATFGIFKTVLPNIAKDYLPLILSETRGGIAGGMIFAAIGGIGGFIISALISVLLSAIYNLISFIFGGIRVKVKQ
jgi:hypothetical protein